MAQQSTVCPRCGNPEADQYQAPLNAAPGAPEVQHFWCSQCLLHSAAEPAAQAFLPRNAAGHLLQIG